MKIGDCLIVRGEGAGGSINQLLGTEVDPSRFTVNWENCRFIIGGFTNSFVNYSLFLGTARSMKNVVLETAQSNNGDLFSEQKGYHEFVAVGGETSFLIPTELLWVPKHTGNVKLAPMNATTAAALNNHYIDFRNRGNSQDLEWYSYPGKDLTLDEYQWTASGSGTSEYYLEANGGGDPGIAVGVNNSSRWINEEGQSLVKTDGTLGSLTAGQAAYGDNDTLGFDTIYVRLSDSSNPNSKGLGELRYIAEEASSSPTGLKHQPQIRINLPVALSANDVIRVAWEAQVI
jgi:hypothetical protein